MEDTPADLLLSRGRRSPARSLVLLLLKHLDAASDYTDGLRRAFESEDVDRALTTNMRLKQAWHDAYTAILILEQVSKCKETNARNALATSYQRAHVPLVLAWHIISRLPNEHRNPVLGGCKCRAPRT
jgi:hypothetical protein